jgi:hypothetical protein
MKFQIVLGTDSLGTIRMIQTPKGETLYVQKADANCERCLTDAYVPHYNCLYAGKAMGHSEGHCTANACY